MTRLGIWLNEENKRLCLKSLKHMQDNNSKLHLFGPNCHVVGPSRRRHDWHGRDGCFGHSRLQLTVPGPGPGLSMPTTGSLGSSSTQLAGRIVTSHISPERRPRLEILKKMDDSSLAGTTKLSFSLFQLHSALIAHQKGKSEEKGPFLSSNRPTSLVVQFRGTSIFPSPLLLRQ